jgi:hypothetical protein
MAEHVGKHHRAGIVTLKARHVLLGERGGPHQAVQRLVRLEELLEGLDQVVEGELALGRVVESHEAADAPGVQHRVAAERGLSRCVRTSRMYQPQIFPFET